LIGNRYLIYNLLNRKVQFESKGLGKRKKSFVGIVDKVTRNIFNNSVVLTVAGKRHTFKEPTAIMLDEGHLVFVYGDLYGFDDSDETLFKDVRDAAYGETVNDVIRRSVATDTKTMRFKIGPKVEERRSWNRKSCPA